jgi:hypothetical protein
MPGKAAKVVITERQQDILRMLSRSVTVTFQLRQRAQIILLGFEGRLNSEIEDIVGLVFVLSVFRRFGCRSALSAARSINLWLRINH